MGVATGRLETTIPSSRQRLSRAVAASWPPMIGVGLMFALWIYGGRAGWANGMVVTPAAAIDPILGESSDVYWRATKATMWSAARGLAIGSLLAFVAALLAAGVPWMRRSITRLAAIANAAPWVAVAPCLIIVLGKSRGPTAVAALAVFFFVFISTTVGLGAAPAATHDVASVLGASRFRRVFSVQLPASWPSIADGLKLAAPAAMAGAVFGEWYGADRGLGVLLISAMQGGRAERLWAASLLAAVCGLLAYAVLAGARALLTRRYGGTIVEGADHSPREGSRLRHLLFDVIAITVLVTVLVTVWWLWIELANIAAIVVPRPSSVFSDLWEFPGEYVAAAGATLRNAAIALPIGASVGVALALLATRYRLLAGLTIPIAIVLSATPLVALFPLFARIFGYEPRTVRILAAVIVFYPMFVYTRSGLLAASRASLDVADSLGGSAGSRFRLVVLPSAIPHIASGLRIAAGSAVIAAVVGEFLIGRDGLGVEFSYAYNLLRLPRAFGSALVIILVSLIVFGIAGKFEKFVHARWT
jgi:sulfonate transport system permease protein